MDESKKDQGKKKSAFLMQASILAAAALISRFIGFLYKVPLTNMIGDPGMGIYNTGYQIYNLLLIISSAGLPVAVSKMVSERLALKRYQNAHKVFEVSLYAASATGLLCSVILFISAASISDFLFVSEDAASVLGGSYSTLSLLTLAPTITLVSVMSVYRGYFQGMGSTVPTAVSQILEQIVNAVTSVALAWYLMKVFDHIQYGAAGGTAGTGIGAAFGLLFILFVYRLNKPQIRRRIKYERGIIVSEGKRKILLQLIITVFPIIFGIAISSFTSIADMFLVMRRLQEYLDYDTALGLYGQLSNKYFTLTTLPVSISSAIATACVPSIAASRILKKSRETSSKINTAMRFTMIISIPSAVGLGILGKQVLLLLFWNYPEGGLLLQIGAISIIFLALYQITTGMLQALSQLHVPIIAVICGVLVKIPLSYILLGIPEINVLGAVISTIVCYVIASSIEVGFLIKITKIKLDLKGMLLKPCLASAVMGMSCYVFYYSAFYLFPSNTFCTVFAIVIGIISYFTAMLLLRGFKIGDIEMMPKGESIVALLGRLGLSGYLV